MTRCRCYFFVMHCNERTLCFLGIEKFQQSLGVLYIAFFGNVIEFVPFVVVFTKGIVLGAFFIVKSGDHFGPEHRHLFGIGHGGFYGGPFLALEGKFFVVTTIHDGATYAPTVTTQGDGVAGAVEHCAGHHGYETVTSVGLDHTYGANGIGQATNPITIDKYFGETPQTDRRGLGQRFERQMGFQPRNQRFSRHGAGHMCHHGHMFVQPYVSAVWSVYRINDAPLRSVQYTRSY